MSKQEGNNANSSAAPYSTSVPIPAVVRWDELELDPAAYRRELARLADWVRWLVTTYRIQSSVIPPCWWRHPGHVETLSHLHTGWQLTRHKEAGVGMTGLDWDSRRVATVDQLRDLVSVASCDSRTHSEPMRISWLHNPELQAAFAAHLDDAGQRDRTVRDDARRAAAHAVLTEVDRMPADQVTEEVLLAAVQRAQGAADRAGAAQEREAHTSESVGALEHARSDLAARIAAGGIVTVDEPAFVAWLGGNHRPASGPSSGTRSTCSIDEPLHDDLQNAFDAYRQQSIDGTRPATQA